MYFALDVVIYNSLAKLKEEKCQNSIRNQCGSDVKPLSFTAENPQRGLDYINQELQRSNE